MIVICVMDDHGGMLFNHRRQSQDRILRAWILQRTKGKKLWMNAYSYEQFAAESAPHIVVSQQFLHEAAAGDYCFVETCRLKAVESRIEAVIVYRWNRSYPTDFWLDLALTPPHWVQTPQSLREILTHASQRRFIFLQFTERRHNFETQETIGGLSVDSCPHSEHPLHRCFCMEHTDKSRAPV